MTDVVITQGKLSMKEKADGTNAVLREPDGQRFDGANPTRLVDRVRKDFGLPFGNRDEPDLLSIDAPEDLQKH